MNYLLMKTSSSMAVNSEKSAKLILFSNKFGLRQCVSHSASTSTLRTVEFLAVEAWELHVVKGPIELDVLACADLAGGGLHNRRCKEVDCCSVLGKETGRYFQKGTHFQLHLSCRLCQRSPTCSLAACLPPWVGHRMLGSYTRSSRDLR